MDIEKIRKTLSLYSHNINDNIILFKDQKTDKVGAAAYESHLFITQEYGNQILSSFSDFYFDKIINPDNIYTFTTGYGYRVYTTKKPDYAAIVYRETGGLSRALEIGDREQWVS